MAIDHRKTLDELIDDVSVTSGFTKTAVRQMLHALCDCIAMAVALDEQVRIHGFGSFSPVDRPQREIADIRTRKKITVPASRGVKFTPSETLIRKIQDPK